MLRVIGQITARVLSTRYGVALLIAAIVLAIVGGAKLLGSAGQASDGLSVNTAGSATPQRTEPDDGEADAPPTPSPVTSRGASPPDKVATAFITAWLHHRGVDGAAWLTGLRPHATPALLEKLTGADPAGVPADRMTGAVQTIPRGESFVEATVPVDSGTVRLRLVAVNGHWLVDGVDWERG